MSQPPSYVQAPEKEQDDEFTLHDLWNVVRRNRWLILAITLATGLTGFVYSWTRPPVYLSEATIRIDDSRANRNVLSEIAALTGGKSQGLIETEMLVLRSRQIVESVVDTLSMHARLVEPRIARSAVFATLSAPADASPALYRLRHTQDGVYAVEKVTEEETRTLPARVTVGAPAEIDGIRFALAPALRASPPPVIELAVGSFRETVSGIRQALDVSRPGSTAQIVSVSYSNNDPVLAAAVPNAVTDAFIRYKAGVSKVESRSTVGFLREQVSSYEASLREAENRLRAFRENAQVISPEKQATEQITRLAELQARRDQLVAEHSSLARLLAQVGRMQPREDDGPSPYRQLAAFPTFLSNRAVQDLLQSLTALENERSSLLVRRTRENVDVQGLDTRIHELELQLYQTAANYHESLANEIASLDANLARFTGQMREIPAQEVEFARLLREQNLLEQIYTLLQTRLKEAEISQAVDAGDVRLLDAALVPTRPIAPRPVRNGVLSLVLGLMLGVGVAFGRKALDTKVRTQEDVSGTTGGLPVLGVIPRIRSRTLGAGAANGNGNGNGKKLAAANENGNGRARKLIPISPGVLMEERLVTWRDPRSPVSEAYRALRTNLTFASLERAPQVIVVTSAMPGDGKTTSASNLAITLAQQGSRVLLVDADLRRGILHEVFGVRQAPGFAHVLMGRTSLADAVQEIRMGESGAPLYFLGSGVFPPNPAEILGSERMRELVAQFREEYEVVVFDMPPLNLVTDAAVVGTLADTTLLVTRSGTTEKGALQHAASQLRQLRARVGGVVLNDFNVVEARYYGGAYGHYGSYSRYGANDE
jgi:tyrosine-protein kinase Etk/Wzc